MAQLQRAGNPERTPVRLSYLISQAWFALRDHIDGALKQHGVTGMQFTLLSVLASREALSSAQLSRRFHITPQAMGQVLTTLEEAGLLTRTEDPANRRVLLVNLTSAGRSLVRTCDAEMKMIEQAAFAGIDAKTLAAMHSGLQTVVAQLRDGAATADG
ncbi:MarR family winged helix-turn-helix transcriptional regulator [Herbaspirillum sp. GCM10030257]|uniref:MarR family winged helix-turn-helix transcriptional regulator n=1 Tax=Herbaspirillum sp. GCM10030257 TaxID=3273393 RepID=UPI00360A61B8